MNLRTSIETNDLVARLNDQRITGFNAQMRVREEAAKEIERLHREVDEWKRRHDRLLDRPVVVRNYGFSEF